MGAARFNSFPDADLSMDSWISAIDLAYDPQISIRRLTERPSWKLLGPPVKITYGLDNCPGIIGFRVTIGKDPFR